MIQIKSNSNQMIMMNKIRYMTRLSLIVFRFPLFPMTFDSRADKCKQSAFFDTRLKFGTNVPWHVTITFHPGDRPESYLINYCDVTNKTIDS